jgi:DNA topoisomerase-6 subunit B
MADRIDGIEMSDKIKEISVAEFFEKNRHLLGYENPTKALITVIKEGLENSLDACEEAGILPEIFISLKPTNANRFKITIEDNGPGIVESKVPLAFAKFLVGSKFHRLRQSRGIQGIGIHGAVLYSQLTTGKPVKVTSSTGKEINIFELMIDVTKNEPKIISHSSQKNPNKWHGVKIELETEGKYIERQ